MKGGKLMKKCVIVAAVGFVMIIISIAVFIAALSAPTVTGPSFNRYIWMAFTAAGILMAVGGLISAVVVGFVRHYKK